MGRKAQPSVTSGGIGITQEVASVGGANVNLGIGVEISPVNLGISVDPSGRTASLAAGGEIPGGLLGLSGGVTLDLNTGEVIGGSVGGEIAGLGINLSNSRDGGLGIEFTLQIPGTPLELSLGLGFPPDPDPERPTPPPTPITSPSPNISGLTIPGDKGCKFGKQSLATNTFYSNSIHGKSGNWVTSIQEHIEAKIKSDLVRLDEGTQEDIDRANFRWGADNYQIDVLTREETKKFGSWIYISSGATYNIPFPGSLYIVNPAVTCVFTYTFWRYSNFSEDPNYWFTSGYKTVKANISNINSPPSCPGGDMPSLPNSSPFPNPPPRTNKKMDECCRSNLALLRAIYTKLGLARFPGQLPNTIIQEIPKEGEQPSEPPQVPIPDLVSLLTWQFERDDERWGQWVVQINVKDSDLTKEGDQGKQIKFPNLAESIAELEGQMLSVMANVDALVAISTKNLVESGMARQEAIKGYLAAKAIIKYMAFKSTEIDMPVPMTFTAGAETISALIQESEGHIKGTDYVEKETLRDILLDLLQAGAVIRAAHWQRIDTKNDTKSQLLNLLKGSVDLAGLVAGPKKTTDGEEKKFDPAQNFEDFIDSVEDGFRNTTGITDIQNPYGKTPDRRPRIREIGDNISQAGGED
jgi:hypothetical protein